MMRVTLNEESQPQFRYEFRGRHLREGDLVDGVWRSQFVHDAVVVRPNCPEYGYDLLRNMDYQVEVKAGVRKLLLRRSNISNVRRPYRMGDWAI